MNYIIVNHKPHSSTSSIGETPYVKALKISQKLNSENKNILKTNHLIFSGLFLRKQKIMYSY